MKIRLCFVSNSSSSSCVCDLCGETQTGMDLCVGDAGMFNCENGHIICQDEAVESFSSWETEYDKQTEEDKDSGEGYYYEVPEKYCPFCCMIEFTQYDLKGYLKKKTGIPEDEVFSTVKAANKRRKKLYDSEYVMYALTKLSIKMEDLLKEIKDNYKTYKEFKASW